MKSALRILIDALPVDSEAFQKFLTLVGEWWRETDGGRIPTKPLTVESEGTNAAMKQDLKKWGFPGRLLPAVKKFRIELGKEDKLFTAFGMKRREAGKLVFDIFSPNLHVNRYIWYQVSRLHAQLLLGNNAEFWRIAKMLLRSDAYITCAINHVLHGWHRKLPYWHVKNVFREVRQLSRKWPGQAELKRMYIPKYAQDGTIKSWRPLGIPKPCWRVYMHMWQNLLTMYLSPRISPNQHGFLPGKGVLTAWEAIMTKAINANYIWEYDLKNFFGEISLEYIYNYMVDQGIPKSIAAEIRKINRSLTELTDEDLAPEPERKLLYTADLEPNPSYSDKIPPGITEYVILEEDDVPIPGAGGIKVPQDTPLLYKEGRVPSQEHLDELRKHMPEVIDLSEMTDDSPVGSTFTVNWGHASIMEPEDRDPKLTNLYHESLALENQWEIAFTEYRKTLFNGKNRAKERVDVESKRYWMQQIEVASNAQVHFEQLQSLNSEIYSTLMVMDGERPKPVPDADITFVSPLLTAKTGWKENGVPQGMPTSPILAIAALSEAHTKWDNNTIAYADDFIKFSNDSEGVKIENRHTVPMDQIRWTLHPDGSWRWRQLGDNPRDYKRYVNGQLVEVDPDNEDFGWTPAAKEMLKAEIYVNWEKSGPVKLGGTWIRPLRFLGMEYDGNKQKFQASTRNGATLEFDNLRAVQAYLHSLRDRKHLKVGSGDAWGELTDMATTFSGMGGQTLVKLLQDLYKTGCGCESTREWNRLPTSLRSVLADKPIRYSWENLFHNKAYGYFMARMQSDTWHQDIVQDFSYDFKKHSWSDLRGNAFAEWVDPTVRLDIFNSSSFAAYSLLLDVNYVRPLVRRVWV